MRWKKDSPAVNQIEIDENLSEFRYFQVAVLVDRLDFRQKLYQLREKWGLLERLLLPEAVEEWKKGLKVSIDAWQAEQERFINKYEKPNWLYAPETRETREEYDRDIEKLDRLSQEGDLRWDVEMIRQEYKRPSSFIRVIERSLLCGKVGKEDFIPCRMVIRHPERENTSTPDETSEMIVIVDQFTTAQEIKEAFLAGLPAAKEKLLRETPDFKNLYDPKNISAIKYIRKYFWMDQQLNNYTAVALETASAVTKEQYQKEKHRDRTMLPTWGSVSKGIMRYKKHLIAEI